MGKGIIVGAQNLSPDVAQLIEQLERHSLAPDGSYLSKSAFSDLQQAREEMCRERAKYLEAMAVYSEAMAMVEQYHQWGSTTRSGVREYAQQQLMCPPQVYESLEHRLAVAEAAQRLRLPLLSKDGEINEEEIEKSTTMSRSSVDSPSTSTTINSSSNSVSYSNSFTTSTLSVLNATSPKSNSDTVEPGVGGVPDRFLGVTPGFLWKIQHHHSSIVADKAEYNRYLVREIEQRLEAKCKALDDVFAIDDIDSSSISHLSSDSLPERVKMIIEEIEQEEAALLEDLCSMDRKFAEHYNVLEQILAVLIKFVKDLKLQHQHGFDELRKTWLSKRCQTMNAKLRTLEHMLLRDTYTKDSIPALHRIREYLLEATEEATIAYNRAITRLREYQGVDPHFKTIADQYHDLVQKLENMRWTIHEVEKDLKRSLEPKKHGDAI